MVLQAQLFYVSIFRQNFDSVLILLIGSPLQFGFAAPPTTYQPVELFLSGASSKLQLQQCRLKMFSFAGSMKDISRRYQRAQI